MEAKVTCMQRFFRWMRFNLMYLRRPPWDTGVPPPELLAFLEDNPPGRALDLGCGSGTNLLAMAQAGWQVTGIDFALRAVRKARRRLQAAGCQGSVQLGDASRAETTAGPFDLVLDIGCYHSLPEDSRTRYRQNLTRLLAPNGRFLLYAHLTADENASVGLHPNDIRAFQERLVCLDRKDSLDRWGRTTAWFTYALPGSRGDAV